MTGILNLRGNDIAFNPVFFSYFYIPIEGSPTLFINIDQLSQKTYEHLAITGIRVEPYDAVVSFLAKIGDKLGSDVSLPFALLYMLRPNHNGKCTGKSGCTISNKSSFGPSYRFRKTNILQRSYWRSQSYQEQRYAFPCLHCCSLLKFCIVFRYSRN